MSFSFRKSFSIGPFRTTLTHRGITNSVGAGGLRYSKTRKYSDMGADRQTRLSDETDQSAASSPSKGNPLIGFGVIALACYGLYKLFT